MILLLNKKHLIDWFDGLHVKTGRESKGFHMGIEWVIGRTSTTFNSINGDTKDIITFYLRDKDGWTSHILFIKDNIRQLSAAPHIEKYINESKNNTNGSDFQIRI